MLTTLLVVYPNFLICCNEDNNKQSTCSCRVEVRQRQRTILIRKDYYGGGLPNLIEQRFRYRFISGVNYEPKLQASLIQISLLWIGARLLRWVLVGTRFFMVSVDTESLCLLVCKYKTDVFLVSNKIVHSIYLLYISFKTRI
jgi:hypothetical protein